MHGTTFVTFRGVEDVAIDYKVDDSGPGSGIAIEWCFGDNEIEAIRHAEVTPEEEGEILDRIIEIASDPHFYDDPFLD